MGKRGIFISFEGIDGVGKTVQYHKLVEKFKSTGLDVFATKEPGDKNFGSNIGAGIRELVFKNPTTLNMRPGVADLLFLADHIQTAGDITDALKAGKMVISDRYADSQFSYGSTKSKACPYWGLELFAQHYGPVPDLLILLKAVGPDDNLSDISWALNRGKSRKGDEQGKQAGKAWNNQADQLAIQNKYLTYLEGYPHVCIISVKESTTEEELFSLIWKEVEFILNYHNNGFIKEINYDNPYSIEFLGS